MLECRNSRAGGLTLNKLWSLVRQTVRLYDAAQPRLCESYMHKAPVLDATFQDDHTIFTAGLNGAVKR